MTKQRKRKSVAVTTMEFNIQTFLSEMRHELNEKVDKGFEEVKERATVIANDLAAHQRQDLKVQGDIEKNLKGLVGFQGNIKWFTRAVIGALIVAALGAAWDVMHNHSGTPVAATSSSTRQP